MIRYIRVEIESMSRTFVQQCDVSGETEVGSTVQWGHPFVILSVEIAHHNSAIIIIIIIVIMVGSHCWLDMMRLTEHA